MKNNPVTKFLSFLLVIIILFSKFSYEVKLLDKELLEATNKVDSQHKNQNNGKAKLKNKLNSDIDDLDDEDII